MDLKADYYETAGSSRHTHTCCHIQLTADHTIGDCYDTAQTSYETVIHACEYNWHNVVSFYKQTATGCHIQLTADS